ncbi:MAG: hypothetical protein FIA94_09465 [Nitrospirae bacterium]|nr:hypothetical protein [Nitrospirota bacterium]
MFSLFAIVPLVLLFLFPLLGCVPRFIEQGSMPGPGSRFFSLTADGQRRGFLLHLPPQPVRDQPVPLVVLFHGYASSARGIEEISGMSDKADREGFVVVYPQGTGFIRTVWNAGFCCSDASPQGGDDLEFFRELIAKLKVTLDIDPNRIYVAGFSNGGMMAYSLAARMPDVIAAAAVISATDGIRIIGNGHALNIPEPSAPVPLIGFHGMKDSHLPYYGGAGVRTKDVLEFFSVAESLSIWVRANGCDPLPARDSRRDGAVIIDTYACRENADIIFYSIRDGGHAWPVEGDCMGRGECVPATDVIWNFFRAHPKLR